MTLAWNRYGKARVRLVKVAKRRSQHDVIDLTIDVQLEGDFAPVYDGDNALCVATDTMKNTVYAFARRLAIEDVETFLSQLAAHFVEKTAVTAARLTAAEQPWTRLADHAFVQPGREQWTCVVTRDRERTTTVAGVADLILMKTADSAFSGFPRDAYTTLPETDDRIFATSVTASWTYRDGFTNFDVRRAIRAALVDTFAAHRSRSVQHTLKAMADAALQACPDVTEITLSLPNRHHLLVDLQPFGLDNPNEVFVATEQPYGLIEATFSRSQR
jgi:urate oxidase